jgi:hypothetical protein
MKVGDAVKFLSEFDQELEIVVNVRDRVFDLDSFIQITVKDWCDKYKIEYVGDPNQVFIEVLANSQNKVGLPRVPKRNNNDEQ